MFNVSDRTYDILKWAVAVVLPAASALYGVLAKAFGWPFSEQVTSTIVAIVMFLGAFLQVNAYSWVKQTAGSFADENNDGIPDYPFKMSGPIYDALKWVAQVALPAASVAYVGLANIWQWPFVESVPTVVSAVVLFLGTILQFSSAKLQSFREAAGVPE